jgi:type I restriction enzyme S subunit
MRPYLRVANVFENRIDISDVMQMHFEKAEVERYELKVGDILLNEGQTLELLGRPAMYRGELPGACFTNTLIRFQAGEHVEREFALYVFLHWLKTAAFQSIGQITTNMAHLGAGRFGDMDFPLPSLREQRRIVAKLDELRSRTSRARAALTAASALLDRLRQSLLATAFRGDLTKDWREQHPEVAPGTELLKRILFERRKKWEQAELAKMKAKGKAPIDDRWKTKYREPAPIDVARLPVLPEGWCWASVDALAFESTYGTSSKSSAEKQGVPVLGMGHIRDGQIVYEKLKTLPLDHREFPALLLRDGDLLFNRTNSAELVGKTAVFRGEITCSFASYLIRLRTALVEPELIAFFINSPFGRAWVGSVVSQQVGQANVNGSKLAALLVPVPPDQERRELLRRIDRGLEQIRRLTRMQSEVSRTCIELDRAILARAFGGELVPQEPADQLIEVTPTREVPVAVRRANNSKSIRGEKNRREVT